MAVSISICNLALQRLRASPITDIAEDSVEAAQCAIAYPQCLAVLMELDDWSFRTGLATLAELATNDRASEWAHAYSLPSDCAAPLRLVPTGTAADTWRAPDEMPRVGGFVVFNSVLFTNEADAVLEYALNSIDESQMPALFRDALADAMAARMAVAIRDNFKIQESLDRRAELSRQRAQADDMKRRTAQAVSMADEVIMARSGSFGAVSGAGSQTIYPSGFAIL